MSDNDLLSCTNSLVTIMVVINHRNIPRGPRCLQSEFFAMNAFDPPHCTVNWCFRAFCTIWVHSWPFGCLTKLGAIRAELVQKFVSRSRVRIFRNELIRSTPLHRKLTFWWVSYYLCAFGTVGYLTKLGHNECTQSTPLDPKLMRSYDLGAFGTVWLPYQTRSQRMHTIHPSGP